MYDELLRNHVYDWNYSVKLIETFIIKCHKTNIPLAQFRVTLFDNFNNISTFTTTHYTMWHMQCVIYISNKSQYLKNEEGYGKTIDGVPLSFQEFFQIRQTSFHVHFKYLSNMFIWHRRRAYMVLPSSENSYGMWMCVDRLCTLHLRTLMYALIINLEKNLLSYCVLGYLGK